jgi:hypothetical protein
MNVVTSRKIARDLYEHLYDVIIENAYVDYYTYSNKCLPSLRQMQDEREKLIDEIIMMCEKDKDIKNYIMHKILQEIHAIYEHNTAGSLIRQYYFDDFVCRIVDKIAKIKSHNNK